MSQFGAVSAKPTVGSVAEDNESAAVDASAAATCAAALDGDGAEGNEDYNESRR